MLNKILFILIFILGCHHFLHAQGSFTGSNLMEFQLGNLPRLEPKNQYSVFDQLNLGYRYKSFSAQTRVEFYYPSFEQGEEYINLSQLKLQYISKNFDIQVGNHYSSLGRGLLLRTYEIPGSIWETRGYRVRYGFYKDILGGTAKFNYKDLEVKVVGGKVLDVTLPPTIDDRKDRRPDLATGMEASYRIKNQKVGLMYLRNQASDPFGGDGSKEITHYTSAYFDGVIAKKFYVYSELAKKLDSDIPFYSFEDDAGYGAYVGVNYSKGSFGASLEYKNYHNIFIGTGINDPPTLVKEHSYKLLNRSTHVPILTDESGYQLDIYYRLENGNMFTFNTSLSKNEIAEDNQPVFVEFFGEYQFYLKEKVSGKVFADYSKDPFTNEDNRYAAGGIVDFEHKKLNSNFEVEWQLINRITDVDVSFSNWYVSYSLSKASKFSATLLLEVTADPIQVEEENTHNFFPSTSFSYHITRKNIATLFLGKRRGGPACNSGVCYDVLDFQGLELRISTRL